MRITLKPLHPVFAAECSGIDIGQPLSPQDAAAIDEGMDRYAVLVFRRSTPLSTEQQIAFSKNFGELEPPYTQIQSPDGKRLDNPALADISNLGPGDRILDRDDRKRLFGLGNQLWHSDSSYKAIPARYSLLCAHVIPPEGGNTEFADMRAAYDALDAKTKALIEDLVCEHSRIFSKGALGFSLHRGGGEGVRAGAPAAGAHPSERPDANRCICPRMPGASSAGRCRKRCCCCAN